MNRIETKILNCFAVKEAEKNMVFAARLTQRGHIIHSMNDLVDLYNQSFTMFFASTFSSKMQIDFLKVAWGISPVLHFPLRHSFRCRRGAVAGIQSLLVTDM